MHALKGFAAMFRYTGTPRIHTSSQVKFILSQHLKSAKGNSERQFSHLVSRTYIASL